MLEVETNLFNGFFGLLPVEPYVASPALLGPVRGSCMIASGRGDLDLRSFGRRCFVFNGDGVIPLGGQIDLCGILRSFGDRRGQPVVLNVVLTVVWIVDDGKFGFIRRLRRIRQPGS